jgi:peroxiredoxin
MNRIAAALVTGTVLAGACTPADSDGFERPIVDEPAPAYAAATLDGDTVSLDSLRGSVVLLNFWATWCGPCRYETPFLQSLYEEHKTEGLEVVGVSMDTGDPSEIIREFMQEYGVTYTILSDPQMTGMEIYQILGLPGTFLIDRDGTLRWMRYGPVGETDADFQRAISDALG